MLEQLKEYGLTIVESKEPYRLVKHNGKKLLAITHIVGGKTIFGGQGFAGTIEECNAEIDRLGLTDTDSGSNND